MMAVMIRMAMSEDHMIMTDDDADDADNDDD